MQLEFCCKYKTGYFSYDPLIKIFDNENKPFYVCPNKNGVIKFNLPRGVYKTENKIIKLASPVKYKLETLPKRTVKRKLPENFKIVFAENPNKCSVFHELGIIIFDNSFKEKPKFFLVFIKLHELGHYFYASKDKNPMSKEYQINEAYCDKFARRKMLELGYNPTQIQHAINYTLTQDISAHRKLKSQNELEKNFKK